MVKYSFFLGTFVVLGIALFLFVGQMEREVRITAAPAESVALPEVPESESPTSTDLTATVNTRAAFADLPKQAPLPNPPREVKGVYLTSWSAGSPVRVRSAIALVKRTELNTVVIDIKDYSGFVAYRTGLSQFKATGAESNVRVARPNAMLKEFHDAGIYVIARVTVFQDPVLAKGHPEWALKDKRTGKVWADRKGLSWLDPAASPVWDYNIALAKDALGRGFDEINFDYIRFASDGDLENIGYPFWDGKTARRAVIKQFFRYLRQEVGEARISADLFGLSTINHDDLGIGQVIEDAYAYFDYVSPMVYPSHYAPGFLGYQNPAKYPSEVVRYSLTNALVRILQGSAVSTSTVSSTPFRAKLRPWLQDFDLGAVYTAPMVRSQIQATEEVLHAASTPEQFAGWLLWDPANTYTEAALQKE